MNAEYVRVMTTPHVVQRIILINGIILFEQEKRTSSYFYPFILGGIDLHSRQRVSDRETMAQMHCPVPSNLCSIIVTASASQGKHNSRYTICSFCVGMYVSHKSDSFGLKAVSE